MNIKKGVLTIAIGKDYVRLASNLAYSFLCFNSTRDIGFTIVSSEAVNLDRKLIECGVTTITSNTLSFKNNEILLNKLVVPGLSPFENTIMLDADCMIAGSLSPLFGMLQGTDFALVGEKISEGYWHLDVNLAIQYFAIPAIYRFVGSFYYFSQKEVVNKVCNKALEIAASPCGLSIDKIHHGFINEEVPLSIAIAMFEKDMRLKVFPEASPVKAETMYYPQRSINLLSGASRLSACSTCFGRDTLEGRWPTSKMALIVVYDSDSRHHLDYKLNALSMNLFMPIRMCRNKIYHISWANYALRFFLVISLSLFLDAYNQYKAAKSIVKRIIN